MGRYANRIENAEFSLSGKTYKLEANNGKNHLHGTFPRKIYDVKTFGDTLLMETESPAGEDGFPGNDGRNIWQSDFCILRIVYVLCRQRLFSPLLRQLRLQRSPR